MMKNLENLEDLIFGLSPPATPFVRFWRLGRFEFGTSGGGMRKQRRRKAKPVRFTSAESQRRVTLHEWRVETALLALETLKG
jgi:hypothetical protein